MLAVGFTATLNSIVLPLVIPPLIPPEALRAVLPFMSVIGSLC